MTLMTKTPRLLTPGIILAALCLSATLAWHANAAGRPPATPTAVATVDLVSVLNGLNEKTVLETRLQTSLDARQAQLDKLVKNLENAQDDLKTLSPRTETYRDKVREVLELRNLAQTRRSSLEQIISIERAEMLRELYDKISNAISRVADRDGWDIVLMDDSAFPLPQGDVSDRDMERAIVSRLIVYRHESVMITNAVITLMNNEYNAP